MLVVPQLCVLVILVMMRLYNYAYAVSRSCSGPNNGTKLGMVDPEKVVLHE